MTAPDRLARRFSALKAEGRGGLVTFVTAGDPDPATSREILHGLPGAGADIIEVGMPFTDPMADGPAIQAASQRALKAGMSLRGVLDLVRDFRSRDSETPVILMGYYNPIYAWGAQAFARAAAEAGADGVIVVDLPPEEADELNGPLAANGLHFIFLATPTTDAARLPRVLEKASGFLYYVSVAGITGTRSADEGQVRAAVARLKAATSLPVAVGFGIKTPEQAAAVVRAADAAVVGSALVACIRENLDAHGRAGAGLVPAVLSLVRSLAQGVRGARPDSKVNP